MILKEGIIVTSIKIDLKSIKYNNSSKRLFDDDSLELTNKNYVYAKNGSGKTTLCKHIKKQLGLDYDVHVFNGFESIIGENENLDAFFLSESAKENNNNIKQLNDNIEKNLKKIDALENLVSEKDGKIDEINKEVEIIERDFDKFYKKSASSISNSETPRLVENAKSYNKNSLRKEITKANQLSRDEINKYELFLKEKANFIDKIDYQVEYTNIELKKYIDQILNSSVAPKVIIERLSTQDKKNFAKRGLEIHKKGDICAFCGHHIDDDVMDELERYFSEKDITQLKDKIDTWKNKVTQKLNQIKKIKEIMNEKAKDIYTTLQTSEKNNIVTMFKQQLMENGEFLNDLHDCLVNKESNLFDKLPAIEISVPSDIDTSKINSLIENNNEVANTLEDNIKQARDKLRYNRIFQLVNEYEEYNLNLRNLEILKSKKKDIEEDKDNHQKKIEELEKEIKIQRENIDKLVPNTEKKAVENINAKLKHNVPWSLTYYKGDHTGYYCIVQDGINRNVRELSTGEKNLIAFLYFIEKLEEKKDAALKQKIILFDDPMSSNDDTMQYLIISELQKLYQGKYSKKFSSDKDYMVILTHNVHFYLNVQPHGNYKDSKNKTKYDKNNFYRISDKKFIKIKNQKEDFKTNYQALWIELKDLYDCGHTNAMLNSMRRIIETYIKFNVITSEKFYSGNEQYYKLFNVNSHSIDDFTAEVTTYSKVEMIKLFHQLFLDNECEEHFTRYWGEWDLFENNVDKNV